MKKGKKILMGKTGLRFQLLLILLVVLLVPVLVMLYDILYASKSDEVVLESKQEHLTEIVVELSSELKRNNVLMDEDKLLSTFTEVAKPMASENEGVRLGLYLVKNEKMHIEGFLHQYRELSPEERVQRKQRVAKEVSAGIKSALATQDLIVRVGRTWDDEFLECLLPVMVNGKPVAVIWAEERLHPIFAKSYHFRLITRYATLIIFCLGVTGLSFVMLNLTHNIEKIKKGLETLEHDINFRLEYMPGEMGQIAKAINRMADGLAERQQLKEQLRKADFLAVLGRLVTGIAHELRNPLGVLKATVEVMEDDLKECPGITNYIGRIKKQIDRQTKTVNELLDYGRPDDGVFETLNINDLILNVVDFSHPLLRQRNVEVDVRLADNLPLIMGSSEKLKQVFLNLVVNAVQAMPQGGPLTIITRHTGEWVLVCIKDAGYGIAEEDLPHIFEPYYTSKDGGSGLGLAICQQIVEVHGGKITASSIPGKGTEMTVSLPVKGGNQQNDETKNLNY